MRQFDGGELIRSMSLAKRLAEGLSKANVQKDDFELAAELICEAYHRAPKKLPERLQEVLEEQMHRQRKKKGEKKPPIPEGERLRRLLNTDFKPGSVYVKLEVQQDIAKETCVAKIPKEQAEAMMEQLMAHPEDHSEG